MPPLGERSGHSHTSGRCSQQGPGAACPCEGQVPGTSQAQSREARGAEAATEVISRAQREGRAVKGSHRWVTFEDRPWGRKEKLTGS